jgi:integrase
MIFDHGQQWINSLRDYAFPKIGRMPLDSIDQTEVMMCLSPIWTEKHETARRLAQRIRTVLDVAKVKGFRSGENPVTAIKDAGAFVSGCRSMSSNTYCLLAKGYAARIARH